MLDYLWHGWSRIHAHLWRRLTERGSSGHWIVVGSHRSTWGIGSTTALCTNDRPSLCRALWRHGRGWERVGMSGARISGCHIGMDLRSCLDNETILFVSSSINRFYLCCFFKHRFLDEVQAKESLEWAGGREAPRASWWESRRKSTHWGRRVECCCLCQSYCWTAGWQQAERLLISSCNLLHLWPAKFAFIFVQLCNSFSQTLAIVRMYSSLDRHFWKTYSSTCRASPGTGRFGAFCLFLANSGSLNWSSQNAL